jgi:hypothetical protein
MTLKFLKIFTQPTNEILNILTTNVIGTPGSGMVYQHLSVDKKVCQIRQPYFICLMRNRRIVATCCFSKRITKSSSCGRHDNYYVRYFYFDALFRRKRVPKNPRSRFSELKNEVRAVLEGEGLGDLGRSSKFFHYAYLDPGNERSAVICKEFGFQTVRQFSSLVFSRLIPKKSQSLVVEKIESGNREDMLDLLRNFYKGYSMFFEDNLITADGYYVLKNARGDVVAGAQVSLSRWRIYSLPIHGSNAILNIFSHVPFLNRLVNKNLKFISLEAIYYADGYQSTLEVLFEHLLARFGVYSAITVVDRNSELYHALKNLDLGTVSKFNLETTGNILCRFTNYSDQEIFSLKQYPAYVSCIDLT